MLYDRIVKYLGRKNRAKRNIILSSLPYENDWLDTATSNTKINQWVVKSDVQKKKEYKRGHPGTAREQQPLMGQFLNLKASSFLG